MKLRDYYELHARDDGQCPIENWENWEIERHHNGLCLCSPGTSADELGYRDESDRDLDEMLAFFEEQFPHEEEDEETDS